MFSVHCFLTPSGKKRRKYMYVDIVCFFFDSGMPQTSGFVIVFAPIESNRVVFRNQNTIYHVCFGPPSRAKAGAFMMVWWDWTKKTPKRAKTMNLAITCDYSITGVRNSTIWGTKQVFKTLIRIRIWQANPETEQKWSRHSILNNGWRWWKMLHGWAGPTALIC